MIHYVYLMSDYTHNYIHSGYCSDALKMIEAYQEHNEMRLLYPLDKYLLHLVYLEELESEEKAIERNLALTLMPLSGKHELIKSCNPDWLELMPGVNIEL